MNLFLVGMLATLAATSSGMGIYLSLRSPARPSRWIFASVILGVFSVGPTIWLANNDAATRASLRNDVQRANDQLTVSLLTQASMGGQLAGLQSFVQSVNRSGWPGLRELGNELTAAIANQDSPKKLNDRQFCSRARDVAQKLRAANLKQQAESMTAVYQEEALIRTAGNPLEGQQKAMALDSNNHLRLEYELAPMISDILYVRDGLQQRLPLEPQPDLMTRIVFN
jgi:hypothetical protein